LNVYLDELIKQKKNLQKEVENSNIRAFADDISIIENKKQQSDLLTKKWRSLSKKD